MDRNETFTEILERLKRSAHGTAELVELTEFLRGLKKEKRPFLQSRFIEAAISWDLNRSRGVRLCQGRVHQSRTVAPTFRFRGRSEHS
jgi:hypothetical protein